MKTIYWAAASLLAAALAAPASAAQDSVTYEDAMKCAALFSVLAEGNEGEPQQEPLTRMGSRWLVIAINRDGTDDGSRAVAELLPEVERVFEALRSLGGDHSATVKFFEAGVVRCEGLQANIADEFAAIEL